MKASYEVKKSYVNNNYICFFRVDGKSYFGATGAKGTGYSVYPTKEQAISAGKRYLLEMYSRGFDI